MHQLLSRGVDGDVHDGDSWETQEQVGDSLIGNRFHLPSEMLFFLLLLLLEKSVTSLRAIGPTADEANLWQVLRVTAWWPGVLEDFPDLLNARDVAAEMEETLTLSGVVPPVMDTVRRSLEILPLW